MSDLVEGGNLCFNIVLGGLVGGYPTKSYFLLIDNGMGRKPPLNNNNGITYIYKKN